MLDDALQGVCEDGSKQRVAFVMNSDQKFLAKCTQNIVTRLKKQTIKVNISRENLCFLTDTIMVLECSFKSFHERITAKKQLDRTVEVANIFDRRGHVEKSTAVSL